MTPDPQSPIPEPLAPIASLAAIILAGGKSTRMGAAKADLPFGPETMLQRVARLLAEVASPIVVVAAAGQRLPELPAGCLVVHDRRPERGPLEGLAPGLAAVAPHADAAYVTSCDVPLLAAGFVRALAERLPGYDAAVPVEGIFFHPLAAVYRTTVLPSIERLLADDRLRAADLFDLVRTNRVDVAELRAADPALATLRNVNRPEDYRAALVAAGLEASFQPHG